MIGFLVPLILRTGIPARFAKAVAWIVIAIAAVLLIWLGWTLLKGQIIRDHDLGQALEQSEADRAADQNAAEQRRADDNRLANEASELGRAEANAQTDLDRRLARQRCIRLQQAARRDGREPPACG